LISLDGGRNVPAASMLPNVVCNYSVLGRLPNSDAARSGVLPAAPTPSGLMLSLRSMNWPPTFPTALCKVGDTGRSDLYPESEESIDWAT
jgi:hypothetical protein